MGCRRIDTPTGGGSRLWAISASLLKAKPVYLREQVA
jgi:hypothetical protein